MLMMMMVMTLQPPLPRRSCFGDLGRGAAAWFSGRERQRDKRDLRFTDPVVSWWALL